MHAQKDEQEQRAKEHAENMVFIERARELLKGFDLMDAAELQRARQFLETEGIPSWTIFAIGDIPSISDAGMRRARGVLDELIANGTLADNPLERLRERFQRHFPKSEAELERSRDVLNAAGIPEDALDFSQADMPITESGQQWLNRWRSSSGLL